LSFIDLFFSVWYFYFLRDMFLFGLVLLGVGVFVVSPGFLMIQKERRLVWRNFFVNKLAPVFRIYMTIVVILTGVVWQKSPNSISFSNHPTGDFFAVLLWLYALVFVTLISANIMQRPFFIKES